MPGPRGYADRPESLTAEARELTSNLQEYRRHRRHRLTTLLHRFQHRPGTYLWAICPRCEGEGKVDHPAFSNGITSGEWADWDQDDRDSYMGGAYDVACGCEGGRVRQVLVSKLSMAERRGLVLARQEDRALAEQRRRWLSPY